MRLTLDRTHCIHHPTACEGCLAEFLRTGALPTRGCLGNPVDDGCPEITIAIMSGPYYGTLVIDEANREEIIYHGWMQFVRFPPQLFEESEAEDQEPP